MTKHLIINHNLSETRIAILESGVVTELHVERSKGKGIVGNIYLGTVSRVLPGMQAAFINIGLDRTAFLYGGDVLDDDIILAQRKVAEEAADLSPEELKERAAKARKPIEKVLKEGQQIAVQVSKEPLGTKGARVTMYLSLPGRYLVLMPDFTHVGVSRRIEEEEERERLTSLVKQIKNDDCGVIIRTAAAGINSGHLQKDLKFLLKLWRNVAAKKKRSSPPSLLYQDLDIALKTTRDTYSDDITKIIVDDEDMMGALRRFLSATIPGATRKVELYEGKKPIFDEFGIEVDIGKALGSRVELPSGGYLIIDQTEALTSFDINTGRFVGQLSAQETILRTNLEAISQIVLQLRVRNIGGIIVIDFIDMEAPEDKEKVYNELQDQLKNDKAKTNVLRISELGLVQMTRKRTAESLERQLTESCLACSGRGRVRSTATEAFDLLREIQRHHIQTGEQKITVKVRNDIRDFLVNEETDLFEEVVKKASLKVEFVESAITRECLNELPYEVFGADD